MKIIFLGSLLCVLNQGYCQNSLNVKFIGNWQSIDGKNTILEVKPTVLKKYHLKKGIKVVKPSNTETASYFLKGNFLHEHQGGGGGINVAYQLEIRNDTLKLTYNKNVSFLYKRISEQKLYSLIGKH